MSEVVGKVKHEDNCEKLEVFFIDGRTSCVYAFKSHSDDESEMMLKFINSPDPLLYFDKVTYIPRHMVKEYRLRE